MNEDITEPVAKAARPTPPKRAVVYLRVASRGPEDQAAVHAQREACERLARNYEIEIVGDYTDLGRSGLSAERPGLRRLTARLAGTPGIGYVIVDRTSRLSRSRLLTAQLMMALSASGARLISAEEPLAGIRSNEFVTLTRLWVAEAYARDRVEARR